MPPRQTVVWYVGSSRCRKSFSGIDAHARADSFANEKAQTLALAVAGREEHLIPAQQLHMFHTMEQEARSVGQNPLRLVQDAVQAIRMAGNDVSLHEMARAWVKRSNSVQDRIEVDTGIQIFTKELPDGRRHSDDLKRRLEVFRKEFSGRQIMELDRPELERWLATKEWSEKTRKHYRGAVVQFMNRMQALGYLPEGINEAAKIHIKKSTTQRTKECFTPEELKALMVKCPYAYCMAIEAFAGLRLEELSPYRKDDPHRLYWSDILWDRNEIYVRQEVAKTEARYVPLLPNLRAWLEPVRKDGGPVFDGRRLEEHFLKSSRAAKIKWKHNGLRHGYGTYRAAITRNIEQVADEMGNSPDMCRRHYRIPVSQTVAHEWFSIVPQDVSSG